MGDDFMHPDLKTW